jgi:signal transduction histidine kinase
VYYSPGDLVNVYYGSRTGLSGRPNRTAHSEQAGSQFGHDVSAAGDVNGDGYDDLLIGAMKFNGRYKAGGKAYVYFGSKYGLNLTNRWTAEYDLPVEAGVDEDHEQFFSWGLSGAGDVNGDGFDDIIVGACFAERGDRNEGMAFLFLGSLNGPREEPSWIAEGNHPHALFGQSVSSAFDVNGDGFDDIIVGIPEATDGQETEGAAACYYGARSGLPRFPNGILEGDHTHEHFGSFIRSAGDINGDGFADVLILGPGYEDLTAAGALKVGRILISFGSPDGLPFRHQWSLEKPALIGIQERIDVYHRKFGSVIYWGPSSIAVLALISGFLFIQAKLRTRIRRLSEENRALVQADERSRIARDIHDHLGANLAQLAVWSELAKKGEIDETFSRHLTRIADLAQTAASDVSRLAWILGESSAYLEDFLAHLGQTVINDLEAASIECRIELPPAMPRQEVSYEVRLQVASVLKEAITNVLKHARATKVTFRATVDEKHLRIALIDNGGGIIQPAGLSIGNGIRNMEQRIASIGGVFNISSVTLGTSVQIQMPWQPNRT